MIAPAKSTMPPDLWHFESVPKQRVAVFLKNNPHGTYNEFLDVNHRHNQIGKSIFDEVYLTLQRKGLLSIKESGKNIEILRKEIRAEVLRENKTEAIAPAPAPTTPLATDDGPAEVGPKQNPLSFPNAVPPPSTLSQEKFMAKALKIGDLTTEQRDKLIKLIRSTPKIKVTDANSAMGLTLDPPNFSTFRYQTNIGQSRLSTEHTAPAPASIRNETLPNLPTALNREPADPDSPWIWAGKLTKPKNMGKPIDTKGYKPETIKAIQEFLPAFLSQMLDPRMMFKIIRVLEDDGTQQTDLLMVRRIL